MPDDQRLAIMDSLTEHEQQIFCLETEVAMLEDLLEVLLPKKTLMYSDTSKHPEIKGFTGDSPACKYVDSQTKRIKSLCIQVSGIRRRLQAKSDTSWAPPPGARNKDGSLCD